MIYSCIKQAEFAERLRAMNACRKIATTPLALPLDCLHSFVFIICVVVLPEISILNNRNSLSDHPQTYMDCDTMSITDSLYLQHVDSFLALFPDSAGSIPLPEVKNDLVSKFLNTSCDLQMQACLAKVHFKLNLTGHIDPIYLNHVTYNTHDFLWQQAQQEAAMIAQAFDTTIEDTIPVNEADISLDHPAYAPSASVSGNSVLSPSDSAAGSQYVRVQPASSAPTPISTSGADPSPSFSSTPITTAQYPPEPKITVPKADQKKWKLKCDQCGHAVRWRELGTHQRDGLGRDKVEVFRAVPEEEKTWYARDSSGNVYEGAMVEAKEVERQGLMGGPCGHGVRSVRNLREEKLQQKREMEQNT